MVTLVKLWKKIFNFITALVAVYGILLLYSAIDAAILTVLWPYVVQGLFPEAVKLGYIAKTVDFHTMLIAYLALVVVRPVNIASLFNKKEKKDE